MEYNRIKDLLLLVFGALGAILFFYSYSSHHPLGNVDLKYSENEISTKADSVYAALQFRFEDFPRYIEITSEYEVLDSLLKKWRQKTPASVMDSSVFTQQFPFYTWEVNKYKPEEFGGDPSVQIELSPEARLFSFEMSDDYINEIRPANRSAVRYVFNQQEIEISRSLEDSLVVELVNYQHLGDELNNSEQYNQIVNKLRELRDGEERNVYTMDNIRSLADYYISRSVWDDFDLQEDSLELVSEGELRFARIYLKANDEISGLNLDLTLEVLPGGSLKSMYVNLSPVIASNSKEFTTAETIILLVFLLFFIWLLIAFYLRIKAKAIDTRPALIIAVLAGFLAPGIIILQTALQLGINQGLFNYSVILDRLFVLAIVGAFSSVGFFVITAVSDSITRQYLPEKLHTWDLVRRGLIRNKPVGWVLINALAIGGLLIGVYTVSILVFPDIYLSARPDLFFGEFWFPSIANLLVTMLGSLLLVVCLFLILSNQVVGMGAKKWVIPLLSTVIFSMANMVYIDLNPLGYQVAVNGLIGFLLGVFYLRYDFLTIALGFFVFLNLDNTSPGWLIENSPDASTFYLFLLIALSMLITGILFLVSGKVEEELPEYVPDYLEDQAKEQRVRQELAIARVVQETFLPSKIHHLPGIDMAGICKPAQETGGDYYDMISLGKARTALAIGDVSGKGIKAAFYMTFTKGVLHSLSAIVLSPVELLNQLNRLFLENATRGTFISMIYGILEADKRTFTFARAGHNPMLLVRQNGDTEWLKPMGVGIGVTNGDRFVAVTEEFTLKLREGDVLVLYTDGITEMMNSGGHFYGEERLERLVKGVRKASSEKIMEIIIDAVNEFKGIEKQHDDMTVIVIKADTSVNQ